MPIDQLKILIVEDEQAIADLLAMHLQDLGCSVILARDGHQGLLAIQTQQFDIAILDIQLPGPCGLSLCRALRKQLTQTWIIMLTARSTELDRVIGLEQGADDYISKPFSVMEIIARVKGYSRRSDFKAVAGSKIDPTSPQPQHQSESQPKSRSIIYCAQLSIDIDARSVMVQNSLIELTSREFDLLVHFAKQPNRVFNRSQLLDQVWGYGHDG